MKLALVVSSLAGGGTERVASLLANGMAGLGAKVFLITIGSIENDDYSLRPDVKRIELDLMRPARSPAAAVINNFRRVRRLRNTFHAVGPDVVVSMITSTNVLSVLAAKSLRLPTIVSERTSPQAQQIPAHWRWLRKYTYRCAAVVVAQTERAAAWLRDEVPGSTVEVIANPVNLESNQTADGAARTALTACHGSNVVLAVGRLAHEKGFDYLLRAFALLATKQSAWRLMILGEGPEARALRDLARQLCISDRVVFPGFSATPHLVMRASQLFVLSSRYEGMPNALIEAMACGVPCISFDCPAGPAELISHEYNGLLVPAENISELSAALDRLMDDRDLRLRLGSAASASVQPYSMDVIMERWNTLLTRVVDVSAHR